MQAEFLELSSPSGERLANKRDQEQAKQRHRQSIVPQEPMHPPDLTRKLLRLVTLDMSVGFG
jgi:hypothetical protein